MLSIGRHALQTILDGGLERTLIFIDYLQPTAGTACCLGKDLSLVFAGKGCARGNVCGKGFAMGLPISLQHLSFQALTKDEALFDETYEIGPTEVGVGYGGEESLGDEETDRFIIDVKLLSLDAPDRDPLQGPDKEVLQVGHFFFFPADTLDGAAGVFSGFLALMTEHGHGYSPWCVKI